MGFNTKGHRILGAAEVNIECATELSAILTDKHYALTVTSQ